MLVTTDDANQSTRRAVFRLLTSSNHISHQIYDSQQI
jgi:hypothetical protein